jgi:hypothetical protein
VFLVASDQFINIIEVIANIHNASSVVPAYPWQRGGALIVVILFAVVQGC